MFRMSSFLVYLGGVLKEMRPVFITDAGFRFEILQITQFTILVFKGQNEKVVELGSLRCPLSLDNPGACPACL